MVRHFTFSVLLFGAYLHAQEPRFSKQINSGFVESDDISEASGIAAGQKNPGVLWVHNDSGGSPIVYAMSTNGKHLGEYIIQGIANRDWEDIAVAPGSISGQSYIYIGEIGDNDAKFNTKYVYRIQEPQVDTLTAPASFMLSGVETIRIKYPDGNRDAETLLVDPTTKDIYIISKRESNPVVYRILYPQSLDEENVAEKLGTLNILFPVAGDISMDGSEILVKNYHPLHTNENIYYWYRRAGHTIWDALQDTARIVPYEPEIQGEAVCWDSDGLNYYTVSEEQDVFGRQEPARLYRYERLGVTSVQSSKNMPKSILLNQNYPNPFNPTTTITYTVSVSGYIEIDLFDAIGRYIEKLSAGYNSAGTHKIQLNAGHLRSGVYYYKLSSQGVQSNDMVKKMIILK